MAKSVLDSSALLAALLLEPGHIVVREFGSDGIMSTVNLSEVYVRAEERGASRTDIATVLRLMSVGIHSFDAEDADRTAILRPQTRPYGISLADRACLALAQRLGLPVYTADRRWKKLDVGVEVRLIR